MCSKSYALGQVGFPKELPNCCQNGSSLLKFFMLRCRNERQKPPQKALPDCHLVHTVILHIHRSRGFPQQLKSNLSLFCKYGFKRQ